MQPPRTHVGLALVATLLGAMASPPRLDGQPGRPPGGASAGGARTDSAAVADALRRFLTAFENLDWPPFRAAFSDSATVFHPAPGMAERVGGPRGIDSTFRAVFADIRAHAAGGPPYHRLVPTELRIQHLGAGLVLVTFHLRNAERLARRTVIFREEDTGWRILHLHASNVAALQPATSPSGRPVVARLASPECTVSAEQTDIGDTNTVWVGLVTDETNRPLRRLSAELARREIAAVGKGLPPATPGGPRRPFAFVACNSTKGIDAVFKHLVGDLMLPAVIGPQYSEETLHALTTHTLPAGAVMLAINATAPVFTTTPSRGLFLRMLTSDAVNARVQARFVSEYLERELRSTGVLAAGEPMKLFLAYRGDAYGRGFAAVLSDHLRFSGKPVTENGAHFRRADFGDPDDPANTTPDARYAAVAADILSMRPHVIAIAGALETAKIIQAVERGWPAALPYRPRWVGGDGVATVPSRIAGLDSTFAGRFATTNVRVNFSSPVAQRWRTALAAKHSEVLRQDPLSGTALAAYDATYAVAYAIASLRDRPLTGANIAAALRALNRQGAPEVETGTEGIPAVYARLERRQPFNLRGATGTLDWDRNGDVLQDIEILCPRAGARTAGAPVPLGPAPSGLHFDVRRNRFVGKLEKCPGT